MSDVLEALGLGAGAGVASAGIGYFANRALAREQQKYYQKNLAKQFAYSQLAQKMAPSNVKQGLVMAGMSPALATEGRFSPAQSPSAPLGSNSVGMPNINIAENMLAMAEAKKASAEAEQINVTTARMNDEDATSALNAQTFFEKLQADALARGDVESASRYEDYAKVAVSKGGLSALHDYFKMADDAQLYDLHHFEYEMEKKVINEQYMKGIWKDIAQMPRTERRQAITFMREMEAKIENLNTDTKGKATDIRLTDAQIEQIKLISKHYRNSDLATMVAEGRWKDAGTFILSHALTSLVDAGVQGGKEVGIKKVPVKIQHVE